MRARTISPDAASKSIARFKRAFDLKFRKVEIIDVLIDRATLLAEKHVLRGYDAVQLVAALIANDGRIAVGASPLTLTSADDTLNVAAVAEGLAIDNPSLHP